MFIILCCGNALAQDLSNGRTGIITSYQYSLPTVMNRDPGVIPGFTSAGTGVSSQNTFGIGIQLQLPHFFSTGIGLSSSLLFCAGSGDFNSDIFIDSSEPARTQTEAFHIISHFQYVRFESALSFRLNSTLYCGSGFWAGYRIFNNILEQRTIIGPSNGTFGNGQNTDTVTSGEGISTSKFHYGIPLIFGAEFPFSDFILTTELFGQTDFEELFRGYLKESLSVGLRIALNLKPGSGLVPTSPPRVASLQPQVYFTVNEKKTKKIGISSIDTLIRRYTMLLPDIYYEQNQVEIPSAYMILTDSSEEEKFTEVKNPDSLYCNLLNIIGQRMKQFPAAIITMTSYRLPDESPETGVMRADYLRSYLNRIWSIPKDRLHILVKLTMGNRPFVFLSDNASILSPVTDEWTEHTMAAPPIGVSHFCQSEAGIASWQVTIYSDTTVVSSFSSADSAKGNGSYYEFYLKVSGASPAFLVADYTVADRSGQIKTNTDTVWIYQQEKSVKAVSGEKDLYIVPIDDITADSNEWLDILMRNAKSSIMQSSVVRIQPLREKTGEAFINDASELFRRLHISEHGIPKAELIPLPLSTLHTPKSPFTEKKILVLTIIR